MLFAIACQLLIIPCARTPGPQHFIGNDLEGWTDANGLFVTRHNFDARISPADMRDSFLPPFEACVRDAQAASFMCSYNRGELARLPAKITCQLSALLASVLGLSTAWPWCGVPLSCHP